MVTEVRTVLSEVGGSDRNWVQRGRGNFPGPWTCPRFRFGWLSHGCARLSKTVGTGRNSVPPKFMSTHNLRMWPYLPRESLQIEFVKWERGHSSLGWARIQWLASSWEGKIEAPRENTTTRWWNDMPTSKGCREMPAATGSQEEATEDPPLETARGPGPADTFILDF